MQTFICINVYAQQFININNNNMNKKGPVQFTVQHSIMDHLSVFLTLILTCWTPRSLKSQWQSDCPFLIHTTTPVTSKYFWILEDSVWNCQSSYSHLHRITYSWSAGPFTWVHLFFNYFSSCTLSHLIILSYYLWCDFLMKWFISCSQYLTG